MSDMPPGFDSIIQQLRDRGIHAGYREWAMGKTVYAAIDKFEANGITAYDKMIYLGKTEDQAWWVLALMAPSREFIPDTCNIVEYTERLLRMNDTELREEIEAQGGLNS